MTRRVPELYPVCPYSGLAVPNGITSREHVIPESIGGGEATCLPVYAPLNELFGTDVDAPFVDSDPILFLRATRGIRGKSGDVPWFSHEILVPFGGFLIPVTIKQRAGDAPQFIPSMRVFKDGSGRPEFEVIYAGSVDAVVRAAREIHAKREAKRLARGRPPRPSSEPTILEHTHTLPKKRRETMQARDAHRFLAKLALGLSFIQFGDDWAKSVFAEALRAVLREGADLGCAPLNGGVMNLQDPENVAAVPALVPFEVSDEEHSFGFVPFGDGVFFHVFVFGTIGARIRVNGTEAVQRPIGFGVNFMKKGELRQLPVTHEYAFHAQVPT